MYFKKIFMDENGSLSYLVGCPVEKKACVVDPKNENLQEYLDTAIKYGMTITHIFDTCAADDPLNGNMALKNRTEAHVYTLRHSNNGSRHLVAEEGMTFDFGQARISIVSSPCHDPFVNCIRLDDMADSSEPWLILRPESLFIGDIGDDDTGGKALADTVTQYLDFEEKNYTPASGSRRPGLENHPGYLNTEGSPTPFSA